MIERMKIIEKYKEESDYPHNLTNQKYSVSVHSWDHAKSISEGKKKTQFSLSNFIWFSLTYTVHVSLVSCCEHSSMKLKSTQ